VRALLCSNQPAIDQLVINEIMGEVEAGIKNKDNVELQTDEGFLFGCPVGAGDSLHSGHAFHGGLWDDDDFNPGQYVRLYAQYPEFKANFEKIISEVDRFVPKPKFRRLAAVQKYLVSSDRDGDGKSVIRLDFAQMIDNDFMALRSDQYPIMAKYFNPENVQSAHNGEDKLLRPSSTEFLYKERSENNWTALPIRSANPIHAKKYDSGFSEKELATITWHKKRLSLELPLKQLAREYGRTHLFANIDRKKKLSCIQPVIEAISGMTVNPTIENIEKVIGIIKISIKQNITITKNEACFHAQLGRAHKALLDVLRELEEMKEHMEYKACYYATEPSISITTKAFSAALTEMESSKLHRSKCPDLLGSSQRR